MRTIRERLHQAPFTPFRMCLSDGRKILIKHPDFVALGGSVIWITDEEDGSQRVDALHIVSLDDVATKRKSGKH